MEKESIGAAWFRFTNLVQSDPTLSIPDYVLLQHFYVGLDKESAFYLDITTRGSFMHKTPPETKVIIDRILENTSFIDQYNEPLPESLVSRIEEPLVPESEPGVSTSPDLTRHPLPEPSPVETEEIRTPECAPLFRDRFNEDYGNNELFYQEKTTCSLATSQSNRVSISKGNSPGADFHHERRMVKGGRAFFRSNSDKYGS
jgi:hypothetical protein